MKVTINEFITAYFLLAFTGIGYFLLTINFLFLIPVYFQMFYMLWGNINLDEIE